MIKGGKKLFEYVEVDDKTPIQKLSVKDQLRVLITRLAHDDANELKAVDAETIVRLQLKANLLEFISKSTARIGSGKNRSVTMSISNKFDSVFDEVINSSQIQNFYTVTVERPDIEYDVDYFIKLTLEVKAY